MRNLRGQRGNKMSINSCLNVSKGNTQSDTLVGDRGDLRLVNKYKLLIHRS